MLALLLLLAGGPPDLNRLGADDWTAREREYQRCDCVLMALLLPPCHENPEVDARVKRLRAKNLRLLDAEFLERVTYRSDYGQWVRVYLATGRTRIGTEDVFNDLCEIKDDARANAVFAAMPAPPGYGQWYLRTNYGDFVEYLHYHWRIAPMPREKE